MPSLQQTVPCADKCLRQDTRAVFDEEGRFVRRTFRRKVQTAVNPPNERMPPQERRDDISEQMPGSVAAGKMREFMREHYLLLGAGEGLLEAGGQADRAMQNAERNWRANL